MCRSVDDGKLSTNVRGKCMQHATTPQRPRQHTSRKSKNGAVSTETFEEVKKNEGAIVAEDGQAQHLRTLRMSMRLGHIKVRSQMCERLSTDDAKDVEVACLSIRTICHLVISISHDLYLYSLARTLNSECEISPPKLLTSPCEHHESWVEQNRKHDMPRKNHAEREDGDEISDAPERRYNRGK